MTLQLPRKNFLRFVCLYLCLVASNGKKQYDVKDEVAQTIIVDLSGRGDYTKLQEAIDSVPEYNTLWILIHIKAGVYK